MLVNTKYFGYFVNNIHDVVYFVVYNIFDVLSPVGIQQYAKVLINNIICKLICSANDCFIIICEFRMFWVTFNIPY